VGCCPAWAMFKDASHLAQAARVHHAHGELISSIERRAARLTQRYETILTSGTLETFVARHLPGLAPRDSEQHRPGWSGVYTLDDIRMTERDAPHTEDTEARCGWFDGLHFSCPIWRLMPVYNTPSAELRAAADRAHGSFAGAGGEVRFSRRAQADLAAYGVRELTVEQRGENGHGGDHANAAAAEDDAATRFSWIDGWDAIALALLLCLFFLGVVSVVARRLFGLDVVSFPLPGREPERTLGLGRMSILDVTQRIDAQNDQPSRWIHLRPRRDEHAQLMEGRTRVDLRDLQAWQAAPPPAGLALLVENLEFHFDDEVALRAALELLERWVYRERRSVHLVALVDPIYYLQHWPRERSDPASGDGQAPDIARWSELLSGFDRLHYRRPELVITPPHDASPRHRELLRLITRECGWDEQLHSLARTLAAQPSLDQLTDEELLLRIANGAGPRHCKLWSLCTQEEKLLLVRLASEGYINPKAWPIARRLERRGLLRRDPAYRIASESLRTLVCNAMQPSELQALESAERSTWTMLSLPLLGVLVALGAFVLWSQPALTTTLLAIVGGATAIVAALIRLVVALRQGRMHLGEFRS
jgi:hypothetical protein